MIDRAFAKVFELWALYFTHMSEVMQTTKFLWSIDSVFEIYVILMKSVSCIHWYVQDKNMYASYSYESRCGRYMLIFEENYVFWPAFIFCLFTH